MYLTFNYGTKLQPKPNLNRVKNSVILVKNKVVGVFLS